MSAKRPRKKRRSTRGSLAIIGTLLIGSAILRLGDGAGQAIARDPGNVDILRENPSNTSGISDMAACQATPEFEPMLAAFQSREEKIARQEAAIRDRMHALKIADEEVMRKLAQLNAAEKQLRETIALADSASENDLERLTKVYETMKPKQAAALFEEMDPNFAAGFLGRMRPEAAAQIMAGLSPQAAHLFSVVLAGRNANAPRN